MIIFCNAENSGAGLADGTLLLPTSDVRAKTNSSLSAPSGFLDIPRANSLRRIPSLQFFSQDICKELGLPHALSSDSEEEEAHWKYLDKVSDQKVVSTFPLLADAPPHYQNLSCQPRIAYTSS